MLCLLRLNLFVTNTFQGYIRTKSCPNCEADFQTLEISFDNYLAVLTALSQAQLGTSCVNQLADATDDAITNVNAAMSLLSAHRRAVTRRMKE
jgi:hypothetical protein